MVGGFDSPSLVVGGFGSPSLVAGFLQVACKQKESTLSLDGSLINTISTSMMHSKYYSSWLLLLLLVLLLRQLGWFHLVVGSLSRVVGFAGKQKESTLSLGT